ncbi:MAG: hypothetical protein J3R72DRAFT_369048 [Linnemannia gamsii]|nr:MAG: hypothetical protein J3R72DRAFT_369048 [Linnemannia gamsii]
MNGSSRTNIATPFHQHDKPCLSHDGLIPDHVNYLWVNNPTLTELCFSMVGRADIEGSKATSL